MFLFHFTIFLFRGKSTKILKDADSKKRCRHYRKKVIQLYDVQGIGVNHE